MLTATGSPSWCRSWRGSWEPLRLPCVPTRLVPTPDTEAGLQLLEDSNLPCRHRTTDRISPEDACPVLLRDVGIDLHHLGGPRAARSGGGRRSPRSQPPGGKSLLPRPRAERPLSDRASKRSNALFGRSSRLVWRERGFKDFPRTSALGDILPNRRPARRHSSGTPAGGAWTSLACASRLEVGREREGLAARCRSRRRARGARRGAATSKKSNTTKPARAGRRASRRGT